MPTVIDSINEITTYQPEYSGLPYTPPVQQQGRLPIFDRSQDSALRVADHPIRGGRDQDPALRATDHPEWVPRPPIPGVTNLELHGLVINNLI